MKVILNNDVPDLGELGDVKEVALGYARNYLLPRGLAFPYNQKVIAMFEKRKTEIEAIKGKKRMESADLKTRLEAEDIALALPAGVNGKLYGAVTNATVADELLKKGFSIDRKKIEIPGRVIKSVGNYKITIHLYDKDEAVIKLALRGQSDKEAKEEAAAVAPVQPKVAKFESTHVDEDEEEADERFLEDQV